jgi:hypothetical protein
MNRNKILNNAENYAKKVFKDNFFTILHFGNDRGIKGFNVYEFKVFLKDGREFYLNLIKMKKGKEIKLVYDLTPKD